jgi:hypothetical protein
VTRRHENGDVGVSSRRERAWRGPILVASDRLVRGRFTGLTIVLLIVLFSATIIAEKALRDVIVGAGFSVLVFFAIWSVGRRLRVVTIALALPTVVGHWTLLLSPSPALRSLGFAIISVFLTFLTLVILLAVFRDESISADTIVGAVCAYFLLGMTWGSYYALLTMVSPDALSVSSGLVTAAGWKGDATVPFSPLMQYYSFTTLATLGYGDVSPLTAGARALSVLEGVTGQLYLAVLIARLVGMHTARVQARRQG